MIRHGIDLDSPRMRRFCKKWKIEELSVFGSILRDDFRPDSDIDFLVSYQPDAEWDISDHLEAQEELASLVGRRVDLLSRYAVETDPNWLFRKAVLSRVERVYAQ